ncbi:hypothetical protein [Flavobacterium macacae]|uniref:DUF4240 domain-containing protein n=1 Tax=Flavobacterium macacae TaxID=2488993 RepID=A0A3P3WJD0_9FLAO|nr:hypothetical protein [Flavobacterium macacae]RRJ92883.1 hypothetical protein EG849_04655 [Flavobacterium macacae]
MLRNDFEIIKQKYKENCRTESTNNLVLKLYSFLLTHEEWDSDFWTQGNGYEDIRRILFEFDNDDWSRLTDDLSNWTSDQIYLFNHGLLCVDFYTINYNEEEINNIENSFAIIPTLLKIGETEGEISDNIENFIKIYFPKVDAKNGRIINAITELKKWNDNNPWLQITGEMIKSPFTQTIENAYQIVCS